MPESAVTIRNLNFSYDSQPALENVNVSIDSGDFACIVGPNGGGKTTLLKLMLGLLKSDTGSVEILGKSPIAARKSIGYLPQHSHLDPAFPANALDVVLMGCLSRSSWLGPYRKSEKLRAMQALESVNLADLASRHFSQLSGGQRQRVLIARALVSDPKLLLLDEPTASLDIKIGEQFYELLAELNKSRTIIVVSHDIGFASSFVKTIVCVHRTIKVHPTAKLTPEVIQDIYGGEVRLIRHEHDCLARGCSGGDHK